MTSSSDHRTMQERTALVTGSTGGLGLAIAEALASAGCRVVLHGIDRPEAIAAQTQQLQARHRVKAGYVQADLSQRDGVARLIDDAHAMAGDIDVLVNNAVVRHFSPLEQFPVEAWDRALAVNLTAPFLAVRRVLPAMRERGWGRIINMSSMYGTRGTTDRIDYVTTKTALLGFTRAVALETVGQGITCNAVCPASVRTPAIQQRVEQIIATGISPADAERQFLSGKQPTGRFIEARHVAELVLFLCTDAAGDITGAMLPVDGGWLAS